MISEYTKNDLAPILNIINNAALKYKGIIPDCCWKEPYMPKQELINEFDNGVRMFGYDKDNRLLGVMGIQEVENVTLIRHAYTYSDYQGMGIGKSLLQYLFKINKSSSLLVGTWKDATWAIRFYMKNGFVLHTRNQTNLLLERYWQVPLKQVENSVVLEKQAF
jgi:GNAT superfamily N-acetyltransferase|tara:strand:- start:3604 stop:4092 length:489 start_codon:yes stop_codon:yes gene_type:complete